MSDKLYQQLAESWEKMSTKTEPSLITESEIREAFPNIDDTRIDHIKSMCEGYLKFEEMILGSSDEILLERFAGDDQAMVPSNKPFDPNATLGKPDAPAAPTPATPEKKKGFFGKAKDAVVKVKEFAKKVKDIYTQLPKKKILILMAAGLVISILASSFPVVGGIAKVAFGGFNIFKGGKGFWSEFKKDKKDRSNVKIVLAVLQAALGIFSTISGASTIVDQIGQIKQQVVAAAGQAAPTAAAPTADAAAGAAAPAATDFAAKAGENLDKIAKIYSTDPEKGKMLFQKLGDAMASAASEGKLSDVDALKVLGKVMPAEKADTWWEMAKQAFDAQQKIAGR